MKRTFVVDVTVTYEVTIDTDKFTPEVRERLEQEDGPSGSLVDHAMRIAESANHQGFGEVKELDGYGNLDALGISYDGMHQEATHIGYEDS